MRGTLNKRTVIFKLAEFFKEKGKVLTLEEYRACGEEVPMRDIYARRYLGSWGKAMKATQSFMERGFNDLNPVVEISSEEEVEVDSEEEVEVSEVEV